MKKLVIYVGHHQPVGERWVEESLVEGLLKTGVCVLPDTKKKVVKEVEEIPSEKHTDKKIKVKETPRKKW